MIPKCEVLLDNFKVEFQSINLQNLRIVNEWKCAGKNCK